MSLLIHMIDSGRFTGKKILAIDRVEKKSNDRTWCFWEKTPGPFEAIVCRSWDELRFCGGGTEKKMPIDPYRYKMIRGIDFYQYCLARFAVQTNIDIRYGIVEEIQTDATGATVSYDGKKARAEWVFNSVADSRVPEKKKHHLLQHFLGWEIETTPAAPFEPGTATLMDFRVSQAAGTSFVYVMPFSASRALVEYTVFSEQVLAPETYLLQLKEYIRQWITSGPYEIHTSEYGIIPMTNQAFSTNRSRLTYIGTAGGQTKGSSGYTFSFIQRQSARLVDNLLTYGYPQPEKGNGRFSFYDSVLLNVLATRKLPGEAVFSRLFSRNRIGGILDFLGNDSNPLQELAIISSLPWRPFARAGWEETFSRFGTGE